MAERETGEAASTAAGAAQASAATAPAPTEQAVASAAIAAVAPPCGCKGIRTCLLCEDRRAQAQPADAAPDTSLLRWCPRCERVRAVSGPLATVEAAAADAECEEPEWRPEDGAARGCPCRSETTTAETAEAANRVARIQPHQRTAGCCPVHLDGVSVHLHFVQEGAEAEEGMLIAGIDASDWKDSQSGRRKQDFGPKVNFKKRKLKVGSFTGLPAFSQTLVGRLQSLPELKDFDPVELCNLEYTPERGAAIDPHLDDIWVWGERLVTLNLASSTVLTFSPCAPTEDARLGDVKVRVPLLRCSLIVVSGEARYNWTHAIERGDVHARRLAITLRELATEFLPGGREAARGAELLAIARSFQGQVAS